MNATLLSENTLLILFDQQINHAIFEQVTHCTHQIERELADYIIDLIPSYNSIYILFKLNKISGKAFKDRINQLIVAEEGTQFSGQSKKTTIAIPVYYGREVAFDLEYVADRAKLSVADVIELHSKVTYDVYAIGFAPGFAYLGNVDQRIATPRKQTPRKKIPKGSLGIADQQTAVYPADSPGGWQIIGQTPLSLVDYNEKQLTKIKTGDCVHFVPISRSKYIELGGEFACP